MNKIAVAIIAILILGGFIIPANASAPRLLVFGDSLSRGLYASRLDGGFKYPLAEMLDAELNSQSGNSLPGLVEIWKTWEWQADVIVVEIGLNDLCEDCAWTLNDRAWMRMYTRYIMDLKATGAHVVICTMFAAHPPQAREYEHFMLRNKLIRAISRRTGATLADLYSATVNCPECISRPGEQSPFGPGYEGDNFHPSDYGHRVIAETIYNALEGGALYIPMIGSNGGIN